MPVTDPIATFTRNHPTTGEKQTRYAYTPDEVVQLTADGWLRKTTKASSTSASSSTGSGSTSSGRSTSGSSNS